MTDSLSDGADASDRLDRWVADAKAKAERYQAMQAQAGQVSVTESSKDGMVTVTVDSAGNLTDLRITDRVRDLGGAQVAAAVLSTLRKAQSRLPDRLAEVMAATIGDDQRTVDTIVENYRAKFPEPEPDEPAAGRGPRIGDIGDSGDDEPPAAAPPVKPPPRRRPARDDQVDEDSSYDEQSFLRRG
jgi:DNA-binding protein YbaB